MSTRPHTYRDDLLLALRLRDVPGHRIAEALAEVDSHVTDSGEDPLEAFGPADAYAEQICEAIGLDPDERWTPRDTRGALVYGLGGAAGAWLAIDGALAWVAGSTSLGLPPWVAVVLGALVVAMLATGLVRRGRDGDPVTDPRDGRDMLPPRPWWVLPVLVTPGALTVVVLVVVWVLAR